MGLRRGYRCATMKREEPIYGCFVTTQPLPTLLQRPGILEIAETSCSSLHGDQNTVSYLVRISSSFFARYCSSFLPSQNIFRVERGKLAESNLAFFGV